MRIAVLIKQVLEVNLVCNHYTSTWIEENNVTYTMNPPDNYALEEVIIKREWDQEGCYHKYGAR